MRRAQALALVVALALAGCPGATSDVDTVTPAPVPTQPSAGATSTPLPCDVPTAAPPPTTETAPSAEEPPPTTAADETATAADQSPIGTPSLPVEDGTVNETALVERHDRVLREFRYEMTRPGLFVQSDQTGPALRVRARSSVSAIRHYAVDGTRYSYSFRYGGQSRYSAVPYDAETFRRGFESSSYSLTGSQWLTDALSVGTYRVDTRRADGWVVLRGEVATDDDEETTDDAEMTGDEETTDERPIRRLNATVAVDHRGVVRSVEQRYEERASNGSWRTVGRSFAVTDVGTATVERPEWVCIAERNGHIEVP